MRELLFRQENHFLQLDIYKKYPIYCVKKLTDSINNAINVYEKKAKPKQFGDAKLQGL